MGWRVSASSLSSIPRPGAVGTVKYPASSCKGLTSSSLLGASASPVYSCRAIFGMQASSWMQAAVLTGLRG